MTPDDEADAAAIVTPPAELILSLSRLLLSLSTLLLMSCSRERLFSYASASCVLLPVMLVSFVTLTSVSRSPSLLALPASKDGAKRRVRWREVPSRRTHSFTHSLSSPLVSRDEERAAMPLLMTRWRRRFND